MSAASDAAVAERVLPPLSGVVLVVLTFAIAFSTFMEVLDITIVNVSVPHIAGSLAVSPSEGTWAISSYAMANAIMQPISGWLARRFGEVRTFVVCTLLFVLFSMLCGLATSLPMLVIGRLLQGAGSGPMVALSLSLLMSIYSKEKQGIALALWAVTVLLAPIFGPILGGWLTDNLSWPWIFYINVPVGLLAAAATWYLMRDRETRIARVPVDTLGIALLVIGVGSLQFMLDTGKDHDWFASPMIVTLGVVALVCISFLIVWERYAEHPVIDLSLFRRRNFTIGVLALSIGMFSFFGINVIFPLWLQTTLGYTAMWAGLAVAPVGILAVLIAPIVGANIHRLELRAVTSFAFLFMAAMSYWFSLFNTSAAFVDLTLPRLAMGLALPLFFIPLNQIYLSGLPADQIASASGLINFFRTLASSVSTAMVVTFWDYNSDSSRAGLAERVVDTNVGADLYFGTLETLNVGAEQTMAIVEQTVGQQAATLAVNHVFLICAVLFLALIPLIWLARPPFDGAPGAVGH